MRKRYKTGSRLRHALAALLLIAVLAYGAPLAAMLFGAHTQIGGQSKTMIILGCRVETWGPSVLLRDRLDTALDYLETDPEIMVIVAGGKGDDEHISEAACMREYLVSHGIDEGRILVEERSSNTHQNMVYSVQMMEEQGLLAENGVVIVSSAFHLTRARMLWRRAAGQEADTIAAPCSHLPSRIAMTLREPLALVKSFLFDR